VLSADMFSGWWGIRTLAAFIAAYHPMNTTGSA